MIEYTLDRAIRAEIARHEPAVKAALAKMANKLFAKDITPEGINKLEGGVVVNGKNIAIIGHQIFDNRRTFNGTTTPEEQAVFDALQELVHAFQADGLRSLGEKYGECHTGNSLNGLI